MNRYRIFCNFPGAAGEIPAVEGGRWYRILLPLLLVALIAGCSRGSDDAETDQGTATTTASSTSNPTQAGLFMSIDDNAIKGESTSVSHRDWIELNSIADGQRLDGAKPSGRPGNSPAKVLFDGVTVGKFFDRSSPQLRLAAAAGRIFGEVKIEYVDSCGGNLYVALAITLSTARLGALSAQVNAVEPPVEELNIDFTRIETMVTPVDSQCKPLPPQFSSQDGKLLAL